MIYYIMILLPGITNIFLKKSDNVNKKIKENTPIYVYDFVFFIFSVFLFITIAFRGTLIGSDTRVYLAKYFKIMNAESYRVFGGISSTEPLYYFLNRLLSYIFKSWSQCIFVAEAFFVIFLYERVIKRYSSDPMMSMIAFMSFGLYLASLCLVRQFIAMSVCTYSLKYVFEKKPFKFYMCILIALCFHYTAVFFGVVYVVSACMKHTKKNVVLFIIISTVGYTFADRIQEITSNMFDRWGHYSQVESGAQGFISFTIYLIITIMVIINSDTIIEKCSFGKELINLNYIHMVLWTIRLVTRNAERISFYFTIAPMLLVPLLCEAIEEKYGHRNGKLFRISVITLLVALFLYKAPRDSSCYPYRFMNFY